jgi:hypothetical protein
MLSRKSHESIGDAKVRRGIATKHIDYAFEVIGKSKCWSMVGLDRLRA